MTKHKFRITVKPIADDADQSPALAFECQSHDDIVALANRLGKTTDDDLLFFVGLKLFGEALLQRRDDPLLSEFRPHFGALMKSIKSR